MRERAVTLRGGHYYFKRPLGARDHLLQSKCGIVRADAHQQAAEVAETHTPTLGPRPGFPNSAVRSPARRVMLFMGNDGFTNLSADGLKLFDAAID